jgi:pimeloyl-ACP methyl ester carboxylesterase
LDKFVCVTSLLIVDSFYFILFVIESFAEIAGYSCLCVDMPGRGRSDFLEAAELYGYPLYIRDINTILASIDQSKDIYFVGTSMGGLIGKFYTFY